MNQDNKDDTEGLIDYLNGLPKKRSLLDISVPDADYYKQLAENHVDDSDDSE